jgi:hypothetical protein
VIVGKNLLAGEGLLSAISESLEVEELIELAPGCLGAVYLLPATKKREEGIGGGGAIRRGGHGGGEAALAFGTHGV